jgi:hypothetical protein
MVVSQGVKEDSGHINVRLLSVPGAIMTRSEARDKDLTCDLDWVVLMTRLEKGLLDSIDDLVTNLKILFGNLLIFINLLDQLFDVSELILGHLARKINCDLRMELH